MDNPSFYYLLRPVAIFSTNRTAHQHACFNLIFNMLHRIGTGEKEWLACFFPKRSGFSPAKTVIIISILEMGAISTPG
jgi:hypothetical protein